MALLLLVVVPRAVADALRRLKDDVVVPAEHDVDARRCLDHPLVAVEAEVGDEDDDIHRGAEQVDVELGDLGRVPAG